ncbi:MAG TPA: amidase [Gemmataceae bacterium]|jgi:aspartyl-tRNA(Asn)/glutamyl-tRNA(Gln) amidotransferase subunit A|nr:amidase [Gemmataceae bacterium]
MLLTIHTVAEEIRQGRLYPVDLLETCLERIDALEPHVRAWVIVDRDGARAEAKRLTEERKKGQWRGPLHGIPLGIKDIFDVFDWPTAAGSKLWANSIARQDATVVERLRQAGAILVGKTVTTAYASFDPPPTRNPWNPARTPGGSSSGSAAAVACGMCLGALGSQTGGSIVRPASYCGVAGCKPTFGRVSVHGVVPLAPSMDHVGPIAGCTPDLAILLQAIAGLDYRDRTCSTRSVPDFQARLTIPLSAPTIGQLRGSFETLADQTVGNLMEGITDRLRSRGANIVDRALPAGFTEVLERHHTLMAVEAAVYHKERLARHPEDYPPKIRSLVEEGLRCSAPHYAQTKKHQRQLSREMLGCFEGVQVLLTPATTGPAPAAESTGNPAFNSPWSYTGLPTVSVPAGWSPDGLPLAIQLVGRPWGEEELFAVAAWCEEMLAVEKRDVKIGN